MECLASYIHRLALAHGVTFYQLHAHLRHWFAQRHNDKKLPRNCESVRYNGYGKDVRNLVSALEEATCLDSLRACTLLPLSEVCAGNGIGAVKKTRAWCPACYHSARERGSAIYDQLLWQIQGVTRCPIHGVELKQICAVCGQIQRNQSSRNILDHCEHCSEDLVGEPKYWRFIAEQDVIERPLITLLSFTSENPAFTFSARATNEYCQILVDIYSRSKLIHHLGEIFHHRGSRTRMQLSSILHLAAFFNVSLALILTEPQAAASQLPLEFEWPPRRQCTPRARVDGEAARHARDLIQTAIASGPPYPSLASISALANLSAGYLTYRLRDSVHELARCRREELAQQKNVVARRIKYWSKMADSMTTLCRKNEKIRWIAKHAKAHVSVVRRHHSTDLGETKKNFSSCWRAEPLEQEKQELFYEEMWMRSAQVMKFLRLGSKSIWVDHPLPYLRMMDGIFFVKYRGRCYYPEVQFDKKERSVLAVVPKLLELLPPSTSGWERIRWLFEYSAALKGRPADMLFPSPERVIRLAQSSFAQTGTVSTS